MTDSREHATQERHSLGEEDGPMEDALEAAFDRQVEEGVQRLGRPWREVLVTGFFRGTEAVVGVLAMVAVVHHTGDPLLGGLGLVTLLRLVRSKDRIEDERHA